jgi:hypothetical protein
MTSSSRRTATGLAGALGASLVLGVALAASAQTPTPATAAAAAPAQRPPPAPMPNWSKTAFDAAGPAKTVKEAGGEACTIFRPETLGSGGVRHPIILWGNGTRQTPENYVPTLSHLASHGFVVAAANTTNAGSGAEMLACLDWLTAENSRAGGPYAGKLDVSKVGASGHSQGGGGTLMAARDARIKVTAPVQPYTLGLGYVAGAQAQQHGPVLMLSGGADTIAVPARNQQPVFDTANTPILWATLAGASHLVPMQGGAVYNGMLTAWFRYQLMGDPKAATMFQGPACGYCSGADWNLQRKGGA